MLGVAFLAKKKLLVLNLTCMVRSKSVKKPSAIDDALAEIGRIAFVETLQFVRDGF
jgi:hypothetical protein